MFPRSYMGSKPQRNEHRGGLRHRFLSLDAQDGLYLLYCFVFRSEDEFLRGGE